MQPKRSRRTLFGLALATMMLTQALAGTNQWVSHGPEAAVNCVQVDPQHPNIVYAASTAPGGGKGLFKSTDAGLTWGEINTGIPLKMFNCLALDPTDPQVLYAGDEADGFMKSTDGGGHWARVNSTPIHHGTAIALDPRHPNIVYLGSDSGIWKSTNGGVQIEPLNAGLPERSGWSVVSLVIDPQNTATVYASAYDELMARSGVWKTVDAGAHWQAAHEGIRGGPVDNYPPAITNFDTARSVFCLAMDPVQTRTLYAGTLGGGVFKTTDGGATWKACNDGMACAPNGRRMVYALAIDPHHPQTLYAGTYRAGIFRSTDGGAHWQACHDGMSLGTDDRPSMVYNLAIDPQHPNTVYAAEYGLGGIYKLSD